MSVPFPNAELDRLLADWATTHQLTAEQVALVRASVLATPAAQRELDAEWFWSLLKPVTALLDQIVDPDEPRAVVSYLKLA